MEKCPEVSSILLLNVESLCGDDIYKCRLLPLTSSLYSACLSVLGFSFRIFENKKMVNKAFSNHSTLSWINHCFYDIHYMIFFFFKRTYIGLCVDWKVMKKRQDILGITSFARALILLFLLVTRSLRHIRAVYVYSLNMIYFLYTLYVQYMHR